MSCFVCHSAINYYVTDSVREKYREVIGFNLCPDSHLCFICCHLVSKLWNFKSICLKRCLEFPMLFRDKGSLNLQISDTDIQTICQEDICKLSEYRNLKNTKIYNNFEHSNCTEDFTHKFSENSNQYVDLHRDFNLEANSEIAKDLNQRIDLAIPSIKNDIYEEYEPSPSSYDHRNECEQSSIDNTNECDQESFTENCGSSVNEQISHKDDDNNDDNTQEFENINYYNSDKNENDQSIDTNKNEQQNVCSENKTEQKSPIKTPEKKKVNKKKKKSFEKIVLSYEEQKAKLEAMRKEKKYLESEYKCYSCALGFLFNDTYQSHMVRHEESNGQFSCNICGLRFATQNAKCMHIILHSELYRCNKCSLEVKRPHRSRHMRSCWRGGEEVASCHLCGKSFSDTNSVQQHLKRFHAAKTSNKVYSCTVCAKIYKDQAAVRTHMLKHLNAKFTCSQCPSTFTSPYTLNQHAKTHVQGVVAESHTCVACDKHFTSHKYLKAHLENTAVHRSDGITCSTCRRYFPSPPGYVSHTCTGTSRVCRTCGETCRDRHVLRRHVWRRHGAPRDGVVCHHCGKSLQNTSKLNRHLREVCERTKMEEQLAELYEQQI